MQCSRSLKPAFVAVAIAVFAGSGSGLPTGHARGSEQPVNVGLRKQLFVDDYVVAEKSGVTRRLGRVTKANGGKPIFTDGRFYGSVLYDQGKFKMWYRGHQGGGYGYAESSDGLHFEKTAEVTGINFAGDYTMSVMIDPRETDAEHRYKAAYDGPGMKAALAHSADGIRWTPYNNGRPVTERAADTCNQILWDPGARLYRLFTRTDFGPAGGTDEWRGARSMTNLDVKADPTAWKTVRSWVFDREGPKERKRRQIYSCNDWIYHGVHFGILSVYEWPGDSSEGGTDLDKRHHHDVMNYYIGTSRDGDDWDLSWVYAGKPIVPRGPDGAFDKDLITPASTIITHDDRHWLYYGGANERHGGPEAHYPRTHEIGLATLGLDRFVGLEAKDVPGIVVTKPFELAGGRLEVNADARGGSLAVEVLDEHGQELAGLSCAVCKTLENVDGFRLQLTWNKQPGFSALQGKLIRLKFSLRNAKLFAFQVRP